MFDDCARLYEHLKEHESFFQSSRRPSITRRPSSTKLPSGDQWNLPFHAPNMSEHVINIEVLRSWMTPAVRQRFDSTWALMFDVKNERPVKCHAQASMPRHHADALLAGDIAEIADERPSLGELLCFPVVEDKIDSSGSLSQRLRPIAWPKSENERIRSEGYSPFVPLGHIAEYLDIVFTGDAAFGRDLAASFFQALIPADSRCLFRFRDESGRLLQYKRIPMGHVCSPEIMHTLVSTLAGDPKYCSPECAAPADWTVRNWIDNPLIIAPTDAPVSRFLTHRARSAGVYFKPSDSFNDSEIFDWAGLTWDLRQKEVTIGPKLAQKLLHTDAGSLDLGGLQTYVSRLIFAAGAVRVPLADFYFALKIARRRLHLVNNPRDYSLPANLPRQTVLLLDQLRDSVLNRRLVPAPCQGGLSVMFSDASLKGWGAILVTSDGRIFISGSRWPSPRLSSGDISALESEAVSAGLSDFQDVILNNCDDRLRIVVDNTSTEAALVNGIARSAAVNRAIRPALRLLTSSRRIEVSVAHIATGRNPADPISRGLTADLDLTREVANDYERGGGGVEARSIRVF